jgi:hypothetical protein
MSEEDIDPEPKSIDFLLAHKQVETGHPVWVPPEDFALLLKDILTRFVGLDEKRCANFELEARYQKVTKRYHLPELHQSVLQERFGLMVGEAIEFRRVAKWIAVQEALRIEHGRNE